MKKLRTLIMLCALSGSVMAVWAQGPNDSGTYYQKASGKKGEALKTALYAIIGNPAVVSYSGLKAAYVKTDTRADGYIRDWYSNSTQYEPGSAFGSSVRVEGDGYNREHLMPQSWYNKVSPMVSDITQVVPTDAYTNSRRNDLPFGEVVDDASRVKTSQNGYSKWGAPKEELGVPAEVTTVFEPNDEIKGDIARIYFYMATCYQDTILKWTGNNAATVINTDGGTTYMPLQPWVMNLMLKWSEQDPVDEVETARNNAVYEVQRNRNPFVDYPGLERFVWGDGSEIVFSYNHYDAEATEDMETDEEKDDDETAQSCTLLFNSTFFGVDWSGARPSGGAITMKGSQDGISVTYAKGESGQNMYCNDSQIRLYKYNLLTFTAKNAEMEAIDLKVKSGTKTLYASTGTVDGFSWTGQAGSVTFNVDEGTGNLQVTGADVRIYQTATGIASYTTRTVDQAIYSLSGMRISTQQLKPGIYIRGGKKFVVR